MIKCLNLCISLLTLIHNQDWAKANAVCDELQNVLATYKRSC